MTSTLLQRAGRVFSRCLGAIVRVRLRLVGRAPAPATVRRAAIYCPHGIGDFTIFSPYLASMIASLRRHGASVDLLTTTQGVSVLRQLDNPMLNDARIILIDFQYTTNLTRPWFASRLFARRYDLLLSSYYTPDAAFAPACLLRFKGYLRFTPEGALDTNLVSARHSLHPGHLRNLFAYTTVLLQRWLVGDQRPIQERDLLELQRPQDMAFFVGGSGRPNRLVFYGRYFKRARKCYPMQYFATLLAELKKRHVTFDEIVFVFGTADDQALTADERRILKDIEGRGVRVLVSNDLNITLREMRGARMFVGPDGGGAHLAVLAGVPTIIAFFDKDAQPIWVLPERHASTCLHAPTMQELLPARVAAAVEALVKRKRPPHK